MNEKFSPELLECKTEIVDCMMEQIAQMEENIENPDFNIEIFAQKLTLSRSVLYKKIKALTNEDLPTFGLPVNTTVAPCCS